MVDDTLGGIETCVLKRVERAGVSEIMHCRRWYFLQAQGFHQDIGTICPTEGLVIFVQYQYRRKLLDNHQ